jgi:hypothetical protein
MKQLVNLKLKLQIAKKELRIRHRTFNSSRKAYERVSDRIINLEKRIENYVAKAKR